MTHKDYEAIAAAIYSVKMDAREILGSHSVLRMATERIANALADDNPRFDRARFLGACGFIPPVSALRD